jgi:Cryptococcal mannosyltransferase 1
MRRRHLFACGASVVLLLLLRSYQIRQQPLVVSKYIDGDALQQPIMMFWGREDSGKEGVADHDDDDVDPKGKSQDKPSIVICGTVRDAQPFLSRLETRIATILLDFTLVRMVLYENDSRDNTTFILNTWKQRNWNMHIISESNVTESRTITLARARNQIWKAIQSIPQPIEYVLMMDMDEVNLHLSHVPECFNLPDDWMGCCANQYTIYYDMWALRAPGWVDCDWVLDCHYNIPRRIDAVRHIPASHAPIPVQSCFGGAALYKYRHALQHLSSLATYQGERRQVKVCEHVAFHQSLYKQNPNLTLYIQPKMLNDGQPSNRFMPQIVRYWRPIWNESWNNPDLTRYYAPIQDSGTGF